MNGKVISLFLAAALLVTAAGCSNEDNGSGNVELVPGAAEPVAYIENPPEGAGDRFNISYDEWHSEYQFFLSRDGYTEEDDPDIAESYKQNILDIQVQERIVLYLAEQSGISAAALTQEELDGIDQKVQTNWDSWCESYAADAIEELGDNYTDEELYEKEYELFSAFLAESGLTPEIFFTWEINSLIQDKFIEKTSESISDQTIADFVQDTIDEAKDNYENDLAAFEQSYTAFYVPEDTRIVQQIYIKLSDDDINEIRAYRNDGDDEKADELLESALEKVRERMDEAKERLSAGEDWLTVQEECNNDPNGNNVDYVVYPTSTYISQDIIDAAMGIADKGGVSDVITTDSGFFILYYKDDRVFSDEEMQNLMDQARDYLKDNESYKQVADFKEQYPYVYDYELMGIAE